LAYEKSNQAEKAKEAYSKIVKEYWESAEYQSALKLKAKLDGNA
jgi:hypothetical protein